MLEQLVVSGGRRKESRKLRYIFLGTGTLVLTLGFSVFVWSVMAMELTLTDEGLELSTLVAPVPIPAAEPPKPEPQQAQPKQEQQAKVEISQRQDLIKQITENPTIPDKVSTTPMTQRPRPAGPVKIGPFDIDAETGPERNTSPDGGNGSGVLDNPVASSGNNGKAEEPPVMNKPEPRPERPKAPVSGGVLNGEAKYLPRPTYPTPARMLNLADSVNVQVVIDEQGNVISAKAVSGHIMFRQAAVDAARRAKFDPTYLTGQAVKVTGVIIYKFSNG